MSFIKIEESILYDTHFQCKLKFKGKKYLTIADETKEIIRIYGGKNLSIVKNLFTMKTRKITRYFGFRQASLSFEDVLQRQFEGITDFKTNKYNRSVNGIRINYLYDVKKMWDKHKCLL